MKKFSSLLRRHSTKAAAVLLIFCSYSSKAQTLAFPGAEGFGRYAKGARGATTQEVYIVTNLNDAGAGSFRDAVSKPGRIVTFAVGGIVRLASDVVVSPNVTIAGQTAPGDGIVFFNKRVTFSSSSNTIARFFRIRLGATGNSGNDASGLANGANMIFDHMSFTWGMDEVFSINWDGKGTAPDNITLQNCIIGQGLHRENHSAGGLIQTPDGGRVSLLKNLYISNKTRNPKVKGVNEFVNNVVYDWGNGNRLDTNYNYGWSGDAYIMGGESAGVSEVNIINNYFVGGPLTPPSKTTPFSRGSGTFNVYGAGNFFDNDRDGVLNGKEVPFDSLGYPGITGDAFKTTPYPYPTATPSWTADQAYQKIIDSVGASYPRRDQVDAMLIDEVASKGTKGVYMYRETYNGLSNGGLGVVNNAPAPLDSDADGMPDAWEDANGLNKNNKADATLYSSTYPEYLNIEVYINGLVNTPPPVYIIAPTIISANASTIETPPSSTVVLKWKDNADNETGFILERSINGTTFEDIAHPAANDSTFTNTDLTPNTTYYYRIKAVNATDSSSYSVVVSVITPPIPSAPVAASTPTPVNRFKYVELTTSGQATIKWSGSTNTTTYSVYVGTDSTNLTKVADVAYVAAPSYVLNNLVENTYYYWRIDASNAKGLATGPVWSFRTQPIIPAGLVAHYSFDDTTGTKVTDSSSYQDHGVLGLDDDNASIRVPGKIKGGFDFATATPNMYVVSAPHQDQTWLNKGSFSLSFWMKAPASLLPQDNNTSAYIMCKGSITRNATTGATGRRIDIETKNKQLRFAIDDDVTKYELAVDGTNFFTNNWVHVVAVRDSAANRLRLYQNGVKFTTEVTTKAGAGIGEESALVIGNIGELEFLAATNAPAPYKGMIDEFKIFNYALTQTDVTALFNQGNETTLPVTLQSFKAVKENNQARIEWATANEQNSDRFEIEHSTDGRTFNLLLTVKSKGNANKLQEYVAYDVAPSNGLNYYRLKQYDADGKLTVHGIRTVSFNRSSLQLNVTPNPAVTVANVQFTLLKPGKYSVGLYDLKGTLVKLLDNGTSSGNITNTINVNTSSIAKGVYVVKLVSGNDVQSQKLVLQ